MLLFRNILYMENLGSAEFVIFTLFTSLSLTHKHTQTRSHSIPSRFLITVFLHLLVRCSFISRTHSPRTQLICSCRYVRNFEIDSIKCRATLLPGGNEHLHESSIKIPRTWLVHIYIHAAGAGAPQRLQRGIRSASASFPFFAFCLLNGFRNGFWLLFSSPPIKGKVLCGDEGFEQNTASVVVGVTFFKVTFWRTDGRAPVAK